MGYVGWSSVANQANTETGGASDVNAIVTAALSAGQGVGGRGAVNLYSFGGGSTFTVLSSAGVPYSTPYTVLNSSGVGYTVPQAVLSSNGTAYNV